MPNCPVCQGEELIPFKRKDGSIVPFAWTYCKCKQDQPERYHHYQQDDFDFPMSDTWIEHYYRTFELPVPNSVIEREELTPAGAALPNEIMPAPGQQQQIDQLKGNMIAIIDTLKELQDKKKGASSDPF